MKIEQFIGTVAGIGTTISFLPQVISVVKNKSAYGISPMMFVVHTFGVVSWVVYGFEIGNYLIVGYNVVASILCFVILFYIVNDYFKPSKNIEELTTAEVTLDTTSCEKEFEDIDI